jgi:hypothetical protein
MRRHRYVFALVLTCLLTPPLSAPPASAQGEPATAQLAITAIRVEPAAPAADTLCRLAVTVRNSGDRKASQLGFSVRLNGQDLSVYGNQLFMYAVPEGGELEIPLYNFWTTETSRPTMPVDGRFTVEVTLNEAQWMDISMEKEMVDKGGQQVEEEVEVWTPLGPVEGLPVGDRISLQTSGG